MGVALEHADEVLNDPNRNFKLLEAISIQCVSQLMAKDLPTPRSDEDRIDRLIVGYREAMAREGKNPEQIGVVIRSAVRSAVDSMEEEGVTPRQIVTSRRKDFHHLVSAFAFAGAEDELYKQTVRSGKQRVADMIVSGLPRPSGSDNSRSPRAE